jgi:hypothetical protein
VSDTSPEMQARYRATLQRVGPRRRLAMGAGMLDAARTLVRAGIVDRLGPTDEVAIRRELFLRFYGDLPEPHRSRALARVVAAARRVSTG